MKHSEQISVSSCPRDLDLEIAAATLGDETLRHARLAGEEARRRPSVDEKMARNRLPRGFRYSSATIQWMKLYFSGPIDKILIYLHAEGLMDIYNIYEDMSSQNRQQVTDP